MQWWVVLGADEENRAGSIVLANPFHSRLEDRLMLSICSN